MAVCGLRVFMWRNGFTKNSVSEADRCQFEFVQRKVSIIRPLYSTSQIRPIVTDLLTYWPAPCLCVYYVFWCLLYNVFVCFFSIIWWWIKVLIICVCHNVMAWSLQNGWTDQDAVWVIDLATPVSRVYPRNFVLDGMGSRSRLLKRVLLSRNLAYWQLSIVKHRISAHRTQP